MKTIEILSNGKHVQFTTKSVTIEDREYLYSHISELRHSEAKHVYGFKCDGEVIMLPYEAKDEQVLKVIFSQVRQMHRKAARPKAEKGETPIPQEAPVQADAPAEASSEAPAAEEAEAAGPDAADATDGPTETGTEDAPAEEAALTAKDRKRLEKEQRKADKEAAKREKQTQKDGSVTYEQSGTIPQDPAQKSARFRKAIIIFIVILAIFALLTVAYYFLIGPASDPQIGPNTTDTPQYNDIDDMINDLEN